MAQRRVPYISASQLDMFLTCPLLYVQQYTGEVVRMEWNIYTAHGWAIHKAFETNFSQKITSRVDLPVDEVVKVFIKDFEKQRNKLTGYVDNMTYETLQMQGEKMIKLFMKDRAPSLMPAHVELEFEIPLKFMGAGIIVKGFIDLITEDGAIRDYKNMGESSQEKRNNTVVANSLQLTMYSLAYRKLFLKRERQVGILGLKRLKSWPKIEERHTVRTDEQVLALVQCLYKMIQIIDKDLYFPNLNACPTCQLKDICKRLSM